MSVWAVAVLIMALVGFSVLYLGAHRLTDVLGGYALGAVWTALVITTAATIRQDAVPRTKCGGGHDDGHRLVHFVLSRHLTPGRSPTGAW